MATESFPVEGAVLGDLLLHGEGHGYALNARISSGLGTIWRIAPSRLYGVLSRLEDEGLITGRMVPQEGRPPRRVFRITPRGEKAFWRWAASPVRHLRDVRVEFLAKLYFLHRLAPERMKGLIDEEIAVLERISSRLARRKTLKVEDELIGRLALLFRLGQIQATVDWLHGCTRELEREEQ